MLDTQVLDDVYWHQKMDRALEIYNYVFRKLIAEDYVEIEDFIRAHAKKLFSYPMEYRAHELLEILQQLELFFINLTDIFVLYDDYMKLLKEVPNYSKWLYIQQLQLDYHRVASVFLRSYEESADLARDLYERMHSVLSPFTEPFDCAVTAVLTSEFDTFLAMEFSLDRIPFVTSRALAELRSFAYYCRVYKHLFTVQKQRIQQNLIRGNEEAFITAAIREQNAEYFRLAAQCGFDDFRIVFGNYIDRLTSDDIYRMTFEETEGVFAKYTILFYKAFGSDSSVASSFLISNIRALKGRDIAFQMRCCGALFEGKTHFCEFITDDAVLLIAIVAFAFLTRNPFRYQIARAFRRYNSYIGEVMQFLTIGDVIRLPKAWYPLELLSYCDKIALGSAVIDISGFTITIPTAHALFSSGLLTYEKMPAFASLLRFQWEQFEKQVRDRKEIKLIFDLNSANASVQVKSSMSLVHFLRANVCRFVKQREKCSLQDICAELRYYGDANVRSAVNELIGYWVDEDDDGKITWSG